MTLTEIQNRLETRAGDLEQRRAMACPGPDRDRRTRRAFIGDHGQATAEYALVLLGAAAIAMLLSGWAVKTGKVGSLLNAIVDQLASHVR